ncbi:pleiotropic regulatory protein [Anopheles sinensis]|uniref:Pleiotropic regulatory protein n=1 Tax=Anopheles sinensis TaxID=74873 RepID=A0A084VSQ0_ANOSI|nr:pleiotropic regulatory protein [Anopheles sinensis]
MRPILANPPGVRIADPLMRMCDTRNYARLTGTARPVRCGFLHTAYTDGSGSGNQTRPPHFSAAFTREKPHHQSREPAPGPKWELRKASCRRKVEESGTKYSTYNKSSPTGTSVMLPGRTQITQSKEKEKTNPYAGEKRRQKRRSLLISFRSLEIAPLPGRVRVKDGVRSSAPNRSATMCVVSHSRRRWHSSTSKLPGFSDRFTCHGNRNTHHHHRKIYRHHRSLIRAAIVSVQAPSADRRQSAEKETASSHPKLLPQAGEDLATVGTGGLEKVNILNRHPLAGGPPSGRVNS